MVIVVGGYIIGYPLGGMTWHHLNYLLGLHELGHEVWFLEDSGDYSLPYNPEAKTTSPDSSYGRAHLEHTFAKYGLPLRYCYYSQFEDQHYGLKGEELDTLLKRADLLLCISGVTPMRESRPRPKRTAVIDTDPVFTQLRMRHDEHFTRYYRSFDRVATFGRLIGTNACSLPTHGFDWIPTNQPVALQHWPVVYSSAPQFTTLGKWEHAAQRTIEFDGRNLASSKAIEWMKLIDLPRRTNWQMILAMEAMPREAADEFSSHGWRIEQAEHVTRSCDSYSDFIRASAGEFTVAKQIYTEIPSGWFSDRSACYLASGKPVVTQSTGFENWLPTGEGFFSFKSMDEAIAGLSSIATDYPRHTAAARRVAESTFDSRKVLMDLLAAIL